jgi:hypothetical protein
MTDVIACTLGARDLQSQRDRWTEIRRHAGLERIETEDGLSLLFAAEPGVEEELRELVAVENDCCGWADWTVSRDRGSLLMRASSSGEGVGVLHGMFRAPRD